MIQSKLYTIFASKRNNKPVGSCGVLTHVDKIRPNIISIAIEMISSSIGNSTLKCAGRILKSCNNVFNQHKTWPKNCLLDQHSAIRYPVPCPWTFFLSDNRWDRGRARGPACCVCCSSFLRSVGVAVHKTNECHNHCLIPLEHLF